MYDLSPLRDPLQRYINESKQSV